MSVDPNSPWALRLGDRLCCTCSATDQVADVRKSDPARLRAIIAHADTMPSARKAAESRLRRLTREHDRAWSKSYDLVRREDPDLRAPAPQREKVATP